MKKTIFFRVDGSPTIGSGHVMRCLTIANNIPSDQVTFLCKEVTDSLKEKIINKNYKLIILNKQHNNPYPNNYESWLYGSQEDDSHQVLHYVKKTDIVIVDHYGIDCNWEKRIKPNISKLIVIDDLANRSHECDYLIDYTILDNYKERYNNLLLSNTTKLLGPQYLILREEFFQIKKIKHRNKIKNILIFFSGYDIHSYTKNIVDLLLNINILRDKYIINVLINHSDDVEYFSQLQLDKKINLYININNIANLINTMDLCIGAAGITLVERCYLSCPSIVFKIADNQTDMINFLNNQKAITYIDKKINLLTWQELENCIQNIEKNIHIYISHLNNLYNRYPNILQNTIQKIIN